LPDSPFFVHLHNHSDYSLLDGASKIEQMVETAVSMGMPALALTDHGNLFGAIQFYNAARKRNIKPIIGCEVYVAKEDRRKKIGGGDQSNHLVLLAKNLRGYQNLAKLVSFGFLEGFYYKPRIDKSLLSQHGEGLIALSACLKGAVPQKLLMEQFDAAMEEASALRDIFGPGNFYLELQDHNLKAQKQVNPEIIKISKKTGIPLVCTNDTHYILPEDSVAHDILLCIGTGKTVNQQDRMKYESDQFYFKSPQEMHELWKDIPEALLNTVHIAEQCSLEIPKDQPLPPFEVPPGHDADSYFEKVTRDGFLNRRRHLEIQFNAGKLKHPLPSYEERLDFEIKMIKRMQFSSYFLIVWDLMKYARDHNIPVGPGRGSVVGSLVAYSLAITDIDPLQYELFFERFLNPERIAPPDIDMDFCMNRRSEMIDYVAQKYGRDNVCQIITFGTMAAKGVIRDVGRSLDIPYAEVDRIAKLIPSELNATIDRALEQEPRLVDEMKNPQIENLITIAKRLEGLSRHSSTHAAGVVIAPKPLVEIVPIQKTNKDEITSQYCMKDLESIGLLKLDFLALTTLTVIDKTVQRVRDETGDVFDLSSIRLDDAKVFKLFSEGRTNGIFQFESGGMKSELRRLKPERFEDLIALNALYRPGPMEMIPDFVKRKQGSIEVRYPHPALEEILKETYGVIVYQEQVMQIASEMGGFSLGEADILRKAMGKKNIDIMNSMRKKFMEGARKKKISEQSAEQVFNLMEQFAQYGFNKSHSTAYALLAYQTAYLKVYYPVQFMAALLSSEIGNTDKIVMYIAECKEMGIPVLPPDINESDLNFRSLDGRIRFGMLAIRNVGEGVIRSILDYRRQHGRFSSFFQFCEEVDSRSLNKRVLESLVKSGALDSLGWKRSQCMDMLDTAIEYGQKARRDRESGQKGLFASLSESGKSEIPEPAPPDIKEWAIEQLLAFEKETLGFYVSGHPLNRFADEVAKYSKKSISELMVDGQSTECQVAGIVTDLRTRRTKKGDLMAIFTLEDLSGAVSTIVFPNSYTQFEPFLSADYPLLVSGRFEHEDERSFKIIASEIEPLPGIMQRNARTLRISTCISSLSPSSATELHRLLEKNRGETGVDVELYHPSDFRINIQSSDFVKVKSSPELIRQIEKICGRGSVQVVN
jgi:DNA polymerase-3 subunit alpha